MHTFSLLSFHTVRFGSDYGMQCYCIAVLPLNQEPNICSILGVCILPLLWLWYRNFLYSYWCS